MLKLIVFLQFSGSKNNFKQEKFVQNLLKWELKISYRAEILETMINIHKKVIIGK